MGYRYQSSDARATPVSGPFAWHWWPAVRPRCGLRVLLTAARCSFASILEIKSTTYYLFHPLLWVFLHMADYEVLRDAMFKFMLPEWSIELHAVWMVPPESTLLRVLGEFPTFAEVGSSFTRWNLQLWLFRWIARLPMNRRVRIAVFYYCSSNIYFGAPLWAGMQTMAFLWHSKQRQTRSSLVHLD